MQARLIRSLARTRAGWPAPRSCSAASASRAYQSGSAASESPATERAIKSRREICESFILSSPSVDVCRTHYLLFGATAFSLDRGGSRFRHWGFAADRLSEQLQRLVHLAIVADDEGAPGCGRSGKCASSDRGCSGSRSCPTEV